MDKYGKGDGGDFYFFLRNWSEIIQSLTLAPVDARRLTSFN